MRIKSGIPLPHIGNVSGMSFGILDADISPACPTDAVLLIGTDWRIYGPNANGTTVQYTNLYGSIIFKIWATEQTKEMVFVAKVIDGVIQSLSWA